MKITILGAGTATSQLTGIPNRYPPGFLVEWEGEKILFECTEGVRFRLEQAGYDFVSIQHIAISHAHADHAGALWPFLLAIFCKDAWDKGRQSKGLQNKRIDVYGPDQIAHDFHTYRKFHLPGKKEWELPWPEIVLHGMSEPETSSKKIRDATLTAFPVYHSFGEIDALAFRLETPQGIFAYSGDTGICDGVVRAAQNADIFICETSARIGDEKTASDYGHLNPRQAGEIAKKANVKKLVFFHYTGLDADDAIIADCQASGYEGEIMIGKDFQVL